MRPESYLLGRKEIIFHPYVSRSYFLQYCMILCIIYTLRNFLMLFNELIISANKTVAILPQIFWPIFYALRRKTLWANTQMQWMVLKSWKIICIISSINFPIVSCQYTKHFGLYLIILPFFMGYVERFYLLRLTKHDLFTPNFCYRFFFHNSPREVIISLFYSNFFS